MAMTDAEMLVEVEAAIVRCLKKQSYRIGDIEYTYAQLPELYQIRRELRRDISRAANTGHTQMLAEF